MVPFFIGVAYAADRGMRMPLPRLVLGLVAVVFAHLSANLINNYYDYKSGADTNGPKLSSFFGGSKLIEQGVFTARRIMFFGLLALGLSFSCGIGIYLLSGNPVFLLMMLAVAVLAVGYTAPPLKLSYRRMGELDIFVLFGIALVMGSFYLFSESFTAESFFLSLPPAFMIAAVIICNEIPDFGTDRSAGKHNLLSFTGVRRGYVLYAFSLFCSLAALWLDIRMDILPFYAAAISIVYILGIKACLNLSRDNPDIDVFIEASRLTVIQHFLVGAGMIAVLLV